MIPAYKNQSIDLQTLIILPLLKLFRKFRFLRIADSLDL